MAAYNVCDQSMTGSLSRASGGMVMHVRSQSPGSEIDPTRRSRARALQLWQRARTRARSNANDDEAGHTELEWKGSS